MKIRQLPDQLIVSDFPVGMWLFGFFFISIASIFIAGTLGLFVNSDEVSFGMKTLVMFVALSVLGGGLWVIYQHPQSITTFDKKDQIVVLKRRGIFGRQLQEYKWKEIANVDVVEGNDDEGGVVYQLHIMMNNGEAVPLTRVWAHSSPRYRIAGKAVKEYLNIDETGSHAIPRP